MHIVAETSTGFIKFRTYQLQLGKGGLPIGETDAGANVNKTENVKKYRPSENDATWM